MVMKYVEMTWVCPVFFFFTSYCFLRQSLIEILGNFYLNTAFQTELFSVLAVTETMKISSLSFVL